MTDSIDFLLVAIKVEKIMYVSVFADGSKPSYWLNKQSLEAV